MRVAEVGIMILYRNRGWLVAPLFILSIVGPAFLFSANAVAERAAQVALLLVSAAGVYAFGARSFRLAGESLGRPLLARELVFDWGDTSPFDSLGFIHVRWWAIGFVVAAGTLVAAGLR